MPLIIRTPLTILLLVFFAIPALSATFYVTSNSDNGPGTLRDAISQAAANGVGTTDYIYFNLSDRSVTGRTIDLQTELPSLTSNLVIDGTTQLGTPFFVTDARIFIRMMAYATSFSMLKVYNCSSVQIYGLYLYYGDWQDAIFPTTRFRQHTLYGVDISNSSNIVIGAPGKGNVLNGEATGIWSADNTNLTHDIILQSNYIGCGLSNPTGTNDVDNFIVTMDRAVSLLNVKNITIGGPTPAEGNVITGQSGLWITSNSLTGNGSILIQNNHFARGYDRTTLLKGYSSTYYIVLGQGNRSLDYFLQLLDNDIPETVGLTNLSVGFSVKRNVFGIAPDFAGIDAAKLLITNCSGGVIGGEDPADANHFLLGQHPGFSVHTSDCGPITSFKNVYECNSLYGSTTWTGYVYQYYDVPFVQVNQPSQRAVSGIATPNCRIDLYYDDECTACEGKIYIGKVQSDVAGNWTYGGPVNGTVVATATNSQGRTGDFSAPRFFTGKMKIIEPSCGNANGSITGITSDGAESFYWENLKTGAIVSNSIDLTNAAPGEYLLFGVHGGTCIKSIGQSISLADVTPHIQAGYVSVTQPGCGQSNGSITNITVSEYSNILFSWVNDQGQVVSNQQSLTKAGPGKYKLIVKDALTGCSDETGFYQLINQSGPTVDVSQAKVTGTTCRQPTGGIENILFANVTGQASYAWLDALGKTVGSLPVLKNVPSGSYRLVFKDQGSCPAITTAAFNIMNSGGDIQLAADKVSSKDESCGRKDGSIQVLDISPTDAGFSFTWIDNGSGQTIGNGTSIFNLHAGSYTLRAIDDAGCPQTVETFLLADNAAPMIDMSRALITPDNCSQHVGAITGIDIQGTPSFAFTWYNASGAIVATTKDLTSLGSGSYYLVVNDQNGCPATSPVVTINSIQQRLNTPVYDGVVVLRGQAATIAVKNHEVGIYEIYSANPAGPPLTPVEANSTGTFTISTLNVDTTVFVLVRKGDCSSDAAAVNIKVLTTQDLIVPDAFTPNSDGHNDLFRIKNPQLVRSFSMMIFDRWGEKVFESADPYKGWDGTMGGHWSPGGAYVWYIYYTDIFGRIQSRRGTVLLVR